MAIQSYERGGVTLWMAYVNLRGTKKRTLRLQRKSKGLKSAEDARSEEKRLIAELTRDISRLENEGALWEEVIERWQKDKLAFGLDEFALTTVNDYAQLLRNWTKMWFGRPAQQLNRADGREVLRFVKEAGNSDLFVRRLKNTINRVYEWGIEERLITDVHQSPVFGIEIGHAKEKKVPEVLNLMEAQLLVNKADEARHPWTPIWKGALLTGMRSGELLALPWSNVDGVSEDEARQQEMLPRADRRYGILRVHRTWNGRLKKFGPTKGGCWRSVPISGELYWFFADLKKITGNKELVFPQFTDWTKGLQAQVLRAFCVSSKLKSVKFHALRATFATLLIAEGVAPARVMKIAGWKDLKTMQFYIRLAGIDERGATEGLHLLNTALSSQGSEQDHRPSSRPEHESEAFESEAETADEIPPENPVSLEAELAG